ncbi:phage baseplate assembly protein V [Salmonella enterica]|nr:phage baseplate assembly protein V [Salmonella enterica]EJF4885538.1 phage baseplate assembly protein V [Salmonella enterica]ELX2875587.1 phage baseplate assembly protein V [Salmonella enterica]
MSLADEIADLRRRVANMIRRGVVSEVRMGSPVTVRVAIGNITTPFLPWIQTQSGRHMQVSNPPAPGDAVTVLSESGDLRNGQVWPGQNIDAIPVPAPSEKHHIIRFDDGTAVRYDREAKSLTITLSEGGTYRITGKGTLDGPVEITDTLTVQGKTQINADTKVKGNIGASEEITDKTGSMSGIRKIYNSHNHPGDSGGTTDNPNQKM